MHRMTFVIYTETQLYILSFLFNKVPAADAQYNPPPSCYFFLSSNISED